MTFANAALEVELNADTRCRRPSKRSVAAMGALAALLWSYGPTLRELIQTWQGNADHSAGILVPFVAAYIAWSERRRLTAIPAATCWWGIALLAAAQLLRFAGVYWMSASAERYSLVLSVAALVLLLFGAQVAWKLRWVLGFLLLMVPLPSKVHAAISLPLQSLATSSAVFGLELLGYLVSQENHVIRMGDGRALAVAEACNGLRMLTAFAVVGAALALMVRRPPWQKALVMLSTLPLAVLINSIRLIVTAVVFNRASGEAAQQLTHDGAGFAMMPLGVAALIGEFWLLGRVWAPQSSTPQQGSGVSSHPPAAACPFEAGAPWSRPAVVLALVVLIMAGAGHRTLLAQIEVALSRVTWPMEPLSTLPLRMGNWTGVDLPPDEQARQIAGDDDDLNRVYTEARTGRSIHLYVGYVGRPRTWISHRPDVCYPAHGFQPLSRTKLTVQSSQTHSVPCWLYEFAAPRLGEPGALVLATYLVDGKYVDDPQTASSSRHAPLFGQVAYLARIQISTGSSGDRISDLETLSDFAREAIGPIAAMMPVLHPQPE